MAASTNSTVPQFDYISAIKSGYDLWNTNVGAGNARSIAGDSAKNWTNQMNNAETSQDGLSGFLKSLGGSLAGATPVNKTAYTDTAKASNPVAPFDANAGGDRANMLAALILLIIPFIIHEILPVKLASGSTIIL